jgi:hypothetical protein
MFDFWLELELKLKVVTENSPRTTTRQKNAIC